MARLDLDLCAVSLGIRRADLADALGRFQDEASRVYDGLEELQRRTEHVGDDVMRRDLVLAESCLRAVIDQLAWGRRRSNDEGA